jgi:hypothetical protein
MRQRALVEDLDVMRVGRANDRPVRFHVRVGSPACR